MQFNSDQEKAIKHGDGPALVIAGPGSGKTSVLTHRILYLIKSLRVSPQSILVITFSKAAALSMEARFNSLCGTDHYPVTFGTFHSVFFRILHERYAYNTSNIANLFYKRKILRAVISRRLSIAMPEDELVDSILKAIGFYKSSGCSELPAMDNNISDEDFLTIFEDYRKEMTDRKLIDFEDMLIISRDMFLDNSDILENYRERFRYILVDECQDINDIQYELIDLLGKKSRNIYMVGDDDQSIYAFRGANRKNLLRFQSEYAGLKIIHLSVNYRSTDEIISSAGLVIGENRDRFAKDIRGTDRKGEKVKLLSFDSSLKENDCLADIIAKGNLKETALLVRTNRDAIYYAEILRAKGIAVSMAEAVVDPYKSTVFRDILHYLSLAENPSKMNCNDFFPVMNKPSRYLSRKDINRDFFSIDELLEMYKDKAYAQKKIKELAKKLASMKDMDLYCRVNYIRVSVGYDDYMKELCKDDPDKFEEYLREADRIMGLVREYKSLDKLKAHVEKYSAELEEMRKNKVSMGEGDAVTVMTYHSSKGLEFDKVYLPHINEGTVPNRNSVGDNAVEEERRMFYVAMTRAKKELIISCVKGKDNKRTPPSRFLYPLLKKNSGISFNKN